jgi:hypothetical protein
MERQHETETNGDEGAATHGTLQPELGGVNLGSIADPRHA